MLGICLIFLLFIFLVYLLTVKEPIHAVFAFIVIVICLVSLLFLLNIEYVALMFLLIYVGAIIILFLFVIMMLNLQTSQAFIKGTGIGLVPISVGALCVLLILKTVGLLHTSIDVMTAFSGFENGGFDPRYVALYHTRLVELFMQSLYTDFAVLLLIVSYILLLALVGSILLTASRVSGSPKK